MNQIKQIETHLNAILKIEDIRINAITIDEDMLIINQPPLLTQSKIILVSC